MSHHHTIIIGAGPAGLTAAYELVKKGIQPLVLEKSDYVGGIARTEVYKGYRFDIGGHRFFTKVDAVNKLWKEILGDDFLVRPRLSRIYYEGKFYHYPLQLFNVIGNLGLLESFLILLSYFRAQIRRSSEEETFDQWVSNRFGKRLYLTFFKTYTEKVWGIPCNQIQAEWAAQRIKDLSFGTVVLNALYRNKKNPEIKTLISEFHYPVLGPGMMWERCLELIEQQGGTVRLNTEIVRLHHEEGRLTGVTARQDGILMELTADHVISTMPLNELCSRLEPPAPVEVQAAGAGLNYRDFLIVGLILDRAETFPDNWIYVHSPEVQVGRIQNFKNWSPALVPDPAKTSLGMEYFCNEGEPLWTMDDDDLIELATGELAALGLADRNDVVDGVIIRQPKAYPVYDPVYREHLAVIQGYINGFDNLQTVGRNGMHRYNNQDHSMLAAMLAVRNILGESHDLWGVNTERSYYEEFMTEGAQKAALE
jgi:protoporphyrinogen oxidase